jgi:hypothetical protein
LNAEKKPLPRVNFAEFRRELNWKKAQEAKPGAPLWFNGEPYIFHAVIEQDDLRHLRKSLWVEPQGGGREVIPFKYLEAVEWL